MKFYTDPGYFFELWYAEIQKDIEQRKAEVRKKRGKVCRLLTEKCFIFSGTIDVISSLGLSHRFLNSLSIQIIYMYNKLTFVVYVI